MVTTYTESAGHGHRKGAHFVGLSLGGGQRLCSTPDNDRGKPVITLSVPPRNSPVKRPWSRDRALIDYPSIALRRFSLFWALTSPLSCFPCQCRFGLLWIFTHVNLVLVLSLCLLLPLLSLLPLYLSSLSSYPPDSPENHRKLCVLISSCWLAYPAYDKRRGGAEGYGNFLH